VVFCFIVKAYEWRQDVLYGSYLWRDDGSETRLTMLDNPKFKFVCDACGSMTIKVAYPERAPETTIVECGRCSSPRGTLAALRDLARQGRSDLFEF
jgi:hypothetical protein